MSKDSSLLTKAGRTIAVLISFLASMTIAFLVWNVIDEIDAQSSAQSDNVQWSLSQAEVEFHEFKGRLGEDTNLTSVRRRFDIFYSRVRTIRSADVFSDLRASTDFARYLDEVEAFLDASVPIVDSKDDVMVQRIPELLLMSNEIRPSVRALSNAGLKQFAQKSDKQREAVARTMTQLAVALAVLISALGLGIIYLNSLNKSISRREREHAQTATRINTIMSTSHDAVVVSDNTGKITDFNNAAEQIFGHKAEDVIGKDLGNIIVPEHLRELHFAGMKRMRESGERRVVGHGRVQLEAMRSDGSLFPVELAIQSAHADEREIFIAFLRDISQQVADEIELIEARDKAIAGEQSRSEFLATMSHEIRTPLNGLLGNMSLLKDTQLTVKQETFMRNMETSGRLLLSHVSDVLDIARYDSGKTVARCEPLNLSALLQDIVDSQSGMATAHGTTLDWGWSGKPQHWIESDSERLQHILMNLIGNAVKFTRDGRVSVTVSWKEGRIEFDIEDTGIGISDDLKGQIFDEFVTGDTSYDRDVSGTGLGLSIVRRFVDLLEGQVSVESTLGEGSTFRVILPAAAADEQLETEVEGSVHTFLVPQRVLVVEDNEINRFVVRKMLEADGHEVEEAFNGREGVLKANEERFDLILMDISMPVLDGRSATREILEGHGASSKSRIVALTANVLPEERKDFFALGMQDVLTKPLSKDALRKVLSGFDLSDTAPENDMIDKRHNAETQEVLGPEGYATMLGKFDDEVSAFAQWIDADRDLETLAGRAHKLAGSAALFGAVTLAGQLKELETAARAGDETALAKMRAKTMQLCGDTRQALNA
ncbi:ATP-binding protein [Planktotalea sp.]|uniref:hybrid sensor histidine kinase/response regulator n=1 Tax=Planktotalea sp. TaxID=2029877 RepID=UPI003296E774